MLADVLGAESIYTCFDGNQWICKTCSTALSLGNAYTSCSQWFKIESSTPRTVMFESLEIRSLSLRVPFMKMVALPSGKQRCIHGPAVNVPSKLDSVCTVLPRLPSQSELIPLKLKRKLNVITCMIM